MRMNRSTGNRPKRTAESMQIHKRMAGTPRRWWRALSVGVAAHLLLGVGVITGVHIYADGWRATGTWSEGREVIDCALAVSVLLAVALLLTYSVRLAGQDFRCASAIRPVRRSPSVRLQQAARGLVPPRRLFELDDARPFAGCIGLWRPAVYVSGGLIDQADPSALRAAVAHEASHLRRRDPFRLAAGHLLAWLFLPPPWRPGVVERLELRSEVIADRFAAAQVSTAALASALLHVARARAQASLPPASVTRAARFPSAFSAAAELLDRTSRHEDDHEDDHEDERHAPGRSFLDKRLHCLASPSSAPVPSVVPPAARWPRVCRIVAYGVAHALAPALAIAVLCLLAWVVGATQGWSVVGPCPPGA